MKPNTHIDLNTVFGREQGYKEFNTKQFTYNSKTKCFVAEASDLEIKVYETYIKAIRLRSHVTGNTLDFFFEEMDNNSTTILKSEKDDLKIIIFNS